MKRDAHQASIEITLSVHTRVLLDINHSYLLTSVCLVLAQQLFALSVASPPPPHPLCYNLLKCTTSEPSTSTPQPPTKQAEPISWPIYRAPDGIQTIYNQLRIETFAGDTTWLDKLGQMYVPGPALYQKLSLLIIPQHWNRC